MIFITGNQNKLEEAQDILGNIEGFKIDLVEIQSTDVQEVVKHKIREAKKQIKDDFIVDDSAVYLGDKREIGALIKYFPNDRLVKAYKGEKAFAVCCIGRSDETIYLGELEGIIVSPRGDNGFGWDKIFQPLGSTKTFAEMTMEEKNKISHRRKALMKLKNNENI